MAAQLDMRMWSIILDTFTMDAQLDMMWSIILDTFTMDGRSIKHEDVVYYSRHLHHGWLLN